MVPLLFRHDPYPVCERQSIDKVTKLKKLLKVMAIHNIPPIAELL